MRELNHEQLQQVSGGVAPVVAIIVIPIVSKLCYEAGKAVGRYVASFF